MRRGGRLRRAALALPLLAPLLLTGVAGVAGVPVAGAAPVARHAPSRGDVAVRIDDVSPSVAARSNARLPLRIRVTLTNTSGSPLSDVRVRGVRGEPIGNQKALDSAISDTTPPSDGLDIPTASPVKVNLPAGTPVTLTFASTISILNDGGLCQCDTKIYPVFLTASVANTAGGSTMLGSAATFVPSELDPVTPVKVSWVWPLIDRPHRLGDDSAFVDDDLATSVSGGRLDRALQVVERLKPTTPITLVVDPELLDELEVMANGKYTVRATNGSTTAGTGQSVASAWLGRFASVLSSHPAVQVSLTPYADPDIQSLTRADLTWSTELPAQMQRRVSAALLGREPSTDVAWPAGGTVSKKALDAMATSGVTTVVLDGSGLSPSTTSGIPVAVARLRSSSGSVTAAATSPAMQRQVAQAVESEQAGTTGANALPYLIAEIAVRAVQTGDRASQAVLTPPRYVDPDPDRAVRTIEDTSTNAFATPLAVRSLSSQRPSKVSSLRAIAPASSPTGLPEANLEAAEGTSSMLPAITSLLSRDTDAQTMLAGLALAAQRVTSSAWRPVAGSALDTALGPQLARELSAQVTKLLGGVRIITRPSGSYTLGSRDSSLPITIENTLPYTVVVDIDVTSLDRVPGYTMGDVNPPRIAANSKETVQVPSRLDRSGRIPVVAKVTTPTGQQLGDPVVLYVRSTVFGTIGIIITFVAGGVLLLALIVRLVRRLQRLQRKATREARDAEPADTVGAST